MFSHTGWGEVKTSISHEHVFSSGASWSLLVQHKQTDHCVPHANCKTGKAGVRLMAFLYNKGLPAKRQNSICTPHHQGLGPHPPGSVDSGSLNPIMYARSGCRAQVIIHYGFLLPGDKWRPQAGVAPRMLITAHLSRRWFSLNRLFCSAQTWTCPSSASKTPSPGFNWILTTHGLLLRTGGVGGPSPGGLSSPM